MVKVEFVRGKFKQMIYEGDNGYKVGLFRVKETTEELADLFNKTITFTGYFPELNGEKKKGALWYYNELMKHHKQNNSTCHILLENGTAQTKHGKATQYRACSFRNRR